MVVCEKIFLVLRCDVFVVSCLAFRFMVGNSSCIVSLLLSGLSGRRKRCVDHAKHEETRMLGEGLGDTGVTT